MKRGTSFRLVGIEPLALACHKFLTSSLLILSLSTLYIYYSRNFLFFQIFRISFLPIFFTLSVCMGRSTATCIADKRSDKKNHTYYESEHFLFSSLRNLYIATAHLSQKSIEKETPGVYVLTSTPESSISSPHRSQIIICFLLITVPLST